MSHPSFVPPHLPEHSQQAEPTLDLLHAADAAAQPADEEVPFVARRAVLLEATSEMPLLSATQQQHGVAQVPTQSTPHDDESTEVITEPRVEAAVEAMSDSDEEEPLSPDAADDDAEPEALAAEADDDASAAADEPSAADPEALAAEAGDDDEASAAEDDGPEALAADETEAADSDESDESSEPESLAAEDAEPEALAADDAGDSEPEALAADDEDDEPAALAADSDEDAESEALAADDDADEPAALAADEDAEPEALAADESDEDAEDEDSPEAVVAVEEVEDSEDSTNATDLSAEIGDTNDEEEGEDEIEAELEADIAADDGTQAMTDEVTEAEVDVRSGITPEATEPEALTSEASEQTDDDAADEAMALTGESSDHVEEELDDVFDDDIADDEPIVQLGPGEVEEYPIALWTPDEADRFRDLWRDVQLRFVDEPEGALQEARDLVTEAISTLAQLLHNEQSALDTLVDDNPDTETMRITLLMYKDFMDRVLAL